jgi:hypothetical protein
MKPIYTTLFLLFWTVKGFCQTSVISVLKGTETSTHVNVTFTWAINPSITFFSCNFQILHNGLTEPTQVSVTQPSSRYTTNITTSGGLVLNCIVDDIPNAIQANTVSWTVKFRKGVTSPICFALGGLNECLNTAGDDFPATLPNCQVVIPVEWLSFQAQAKNKDSVVLDWATATEQNIQHFSVERSHNGQIFEQIGAFVPAKNALAKNEYHVIDPTPLSGVSFYRIREVDFNGKESFSVIRSVVLKEDKTIFVLYPNPKSKEGPLSIQTSFDDNYTFNLYNATGKLLYSHACKGAVQLNDLNLIGGLYFYECTTPQDKTAGKLVVPN